MKSFLKYLKETYAHNPKRLVFWGGEPLLYWNLIKEVVEKLDDSAFSYWIMSNGVLLKDEHVDFINAHEINLSISNDGPLTAKVRGVNVLDDPAFCERFNKVKHRCIGITRKLFKSTLNNRLHSNLACVIDKSSRVAKLKRAFEELPQLMPTTLIHTPWPLT